MPNSIVERPPVTQTKTKKTKRSRPTPPGQRLIGYTALSALLLLLQGASIPIGVKNINSSDLAIMAEAAPPPPPIKLDVSLDQLKAKLAEVSEVKNLHAGLFVTDQKSGRYVDLNGHESFAAASMIKVPVFVALLNAIDQGRISPNQLLVVRQDLITGGSGWLQWRPVGSKISVRDTAELMITISDNTATNMLIDALGGIQACNLAFQEWGLNNTHIKNWLGDFAGTNTTSPYDLVYLLARIDRGEILSPASKQWLYQTMSRTKIRTLLPPGLGPGAKIAHKTGDIASMVGDVGVITVPSGDKYFVSVQVSRPHNDRRANLLIRSLSKMIYQCFSTDSEDCAEVAAVPLESMNESPVVHHRRRHRRHT
jgi:beta-lactamase class A